MSTNRNRIIYNVQDLFFGSAANEVHPIPGHEVLKRINRLQKFDYSISTTRSPTPVLGRKNVVSNKVLEPPSVSLSFSYILEGVNNEMRMGLDVINEVTAFDHLYPESPNLVSGFLDPSKSGDRRHVYLTVNNKDEDTHGQHGGYLDYELTGINHVPFVGDPQASGYGVYVFQNSYMSSYSVNVSLGELPTASVNMTADNLIYYSKGSGISLPYLDTKKGVSTDLLPIYASDFDGQADGWENVNPGSFFDYMGDPEAIAVCGAGAGDISHYIRQEFTEITVGKRYRIKGSVYIPAGSKVDGVAVYQGTSHIIRGHNDPVSEGVTNEWVDFDENWTAENINNGTWIYIYGLDSSSSNDYLWTAAGSSPYDCFRLRNIELSEITEIVVPKHFNEADGNLAQGMSMFRPGDITVTIAKNGDPGILYHNETVQGFNAEISIPREPVSYLGYKMYADRPIMPPIAANVSLAMLAKETLTGDFFSDIRRDEDYDIEVLFKDKEGEAGLKYIISGAKFLEVSYDSAVGDAGKTSKMNFNVPLDLDSYKRGFYVSGSVIAVVGDLYESGNVGTPDIDKNLYEVIDGEDWDLGQAIIPSY